uniref:Dentin sialophosphoprotein-like n=1 Tax=Saccoglossus kowalevskii TaxID=10224 RepID=A0ABM0LYY8_SACKO|nr:PREDICTED: dentin sialophosphoprotein-like [Saccoglossus kowalevskii]
MAFTKSFVASSDKKGSPAMWPFNNILQLGRIGNNTEALCHSEVQKETYRPRFLRLDSTGENSNGFDFREASDRTCRGLSDNLQTGGNLMQTKTKNHYQSVTDRVLDAVHQLFNSSTVLNQSQRYGVQSWPVCGSEFDFNLTNFCRQYIDEICDFSRVNNNFHPSRENRVFMFGRLSNLINNMYNTTAGAIRDNVTSDMLNSGQVCTEQMTQPMTNSLQITPQTYPINCDTTEKLQAETNTQKGHIQTDVNSHLSSCGAVLSNSVIDSYHGDTCTYQDYCDTECGKVHSYRTDQAGHNGCIILQADQHLDEISQCRKKLKCSSFSDLNISTSQNELVTSGQSQSIHTSEQNSTMPVENSKPTCLQSCTSNDDNFNDFQPFEFCRKDPLLESQSDISFQSSLNCSRNDTTESMLFEVAHRLSACSLLSNESDVCFQGDTFLHGNKDGSSDDVVADTGFASKNSSRSISFIVGGDDFDSDWSSDSDYDECDNDAADLQESIWNSFMTSGDPYNPIYGWQCNMTESTKLTKTTSSPNLLSGASTPRAIPHHNTTPECNSSRNYILFKHTSTPKTSMGDSIMEEHRTF